jgi:dipeptidyl aminopeptidase/acylaminoacyl peptidase
MRRITLLLVLSLSTSALAQQRRVMSFDDFSAVRAVSDPQLSPDGARVLYAVRTTDVAANRRTTRTYVLPVSGGAPTQFPNGNTIAAEARWSPDGAWVAYVADGQLWVADASGGNAKQLTSLTGGAGGPVWSPAGDRVAFVSAVYPDCADDACNAARQKAASDSKVRARITDELMYRHWNAYSDGTKAHLFVVKIDGSELRDLTPRAKYDVPPGPFGGSEGYVISPDGREAAFTAKDQGRAEAWTTDVNVYVVPTDGSAAPVAVTAANKGADQNPVYSPDGRWILYASQARAGFESDRWRLMAYDRQTKRAKELAPTWDRSAETYLVAPDSRHIIVGTGNRGRDAYFHLPLDATASTARPTPLIEGMNNVALSLSRDGRTIVWMRDAANRPGEVWIATLQPANDQMEISAKTAAGAPTVPTLGQVEVTSRPGGSVAVMRGALTVQRAQQLTHENDAFIAQLALNPAEDFWFRGAAGDSVHGWVIKPPQFEAGKKYPLLLLIHGGPQGAWFDAWGSRWAPQMFAAGGYGVVMINPHGSTGYGQKFVDAVSKDWGGKTYVDLMRGVDAALVKNKWLDSTRMAAAGGSYGGYMANWLEGHTTRFKTLVSHAGVFNLEAMAGATEELWFTDWEFGGPWWNPQAMASQYRKYSPHLYAAKFKTPMLVFHGELDYRVPYTEGLSLFTALQRQGVPSRLVVFPDEGHWILKPQNSQLWWREMHSWLGKYLNERPIS